MQKRNIFSSLPRFFSFTCKGSVEVGGEVVGVNVLDVQQVRVHRGEYAALVGRQALRKHVNSKISSDLRKV